VKEKIHPEYKPVKVVCGCGNTFETRSTAKTMNIDICSKCHPFYTGKQKLLDSAGRVEKFNKRYKIEAKPAAKQ
jgi:large subunit ribosomal protein L31